MPPLELIVASRNRGKVVEIATMLSGLPVKLRSLEEFSGITAVEECGDSYEQNAAIKAMGYAAQTNRWSIADDSGLEVDVLGGAPGLFSARYAEEGSSDETRMTQLLEELSRTTSRDWRARFICVMAIADPHSGLVNAARGTCEGHIARSPRGLGGFGFDPIFIPDGYTSTFAELSPEVKNTISHRAKALMATHRFLRAIFSNHHLTGNPGRP